MGGDRTGDPRAEEGDLKKVLRVGQEPAGAGLPADEPRVTGVWEPPAGPPPRGEQTSLLRAQHWTQLLGPVRE